MLLCMMLASAGLSFSSMAFADKTTIDIHADQIIHPVNQFLTGVCIEDVNHEIYGGLYSQMIFGESFQEPPSNDPIKGFHAYGGSWTVADHAIEIDGADGPKLVSDHVPFADGTINVEMRFTGRDGQNAGLIARVARPGVGADAFTGYEISLDPARQAVRLARHRENFELIADVPCDVPIDRWFALQVTLQGSQIEIRVDGKIALRYDDHSACFPPEEWASAPGTARRAFEIWR